MLHDEILFLLRNNKNVIIPEVGAIMIKAGTGSLTFNEFLKYNDGILAEHLCSAKGIDKAEASKEIKKFSNDIIKSLASEKKYDLGPIGYLQIDANGKIELQSNLAIDAGLTNNENNSIKEAINETPKEKPPYKAPKTKSLHEENNSKASNTATLKHSSMSHTTNHSKSTDSNSFQHDEFSRYEKSRKGKVVMIIVAIVILLGSAAYFVFLKNPEILSFLHKSANSADTSVVSVPATVSTPKTESLPAVDNTTPLSDAKNKYHIIAGAFVVDKNANAFMQDLKSKGYDSKVVLKRNEYSFISIFSYPTFKEANDKFKTLGNTGMPIWIMKYQER
jgi:hypothetical protein